MGVPGLTTQLLPFASTLYFAAHQQVTEASDNIHAAATCCAETQKQLNLIVDGPAFAYHVFDQCLSSRRQSHVGISSLPAYSEISTATIRLLDHLELFGLRLDSIFFDGFLPENKHQIRRNRLQKSYQMLSKFRISTCSAPHGLKRTSYDKEPTADFPRNFKRATPQILSSTAPPLPLLVPCVMETLAKHKTFSSALKVCPGEAEIFCKLRSEVVASGLILTNDSDLVILNPKCPVAFLRSFDFDLEQPASLKILVFSPSEIAQQLDCLDLVKLGYQLSVSPGTSLRECAALAKRDGFPENDNAYGEFRETYFPKPVEKLDEYYQYGNIRKVMRALDPRISEIVIDVLFPSKSENLAYMILPPFFEDTSRASAWKISLPIRLVAYDLLALCNPHQKIDIIEVDRRGDRPVEQTIQKRHPSDTNNAVKDFWDYLSELRLPRDWTEDDVFSVLSMWCSTALHQTLDNLEAESKLPPRRDVEMILDRAKYPQINWSALHFQAQTEGFLYSYRILKQVLDIYCANKQDHADVVSGRPHSENYRVSQLDEGLLMKLETKLDALPQIRDLHRCPGQQFEIGDQALRISAKLDEVYGSRHQTSKEKGALNESCSTRRGSKLASRYRSGATSGLKHNADTSSNPFSCLEVDEDQQI